MNVLLVCNEADTLAIFEDFCRGADYPLVNSSSLSDAAAVMESQNFDVLVVEGCTSNLAGLPIIRDQRNRVPPPFILIVGNNSELEASGALKLRADGFLTKPIQPALIALNFTQAS